MAFRANAGQADSVAFVTRKSPPSIGNLCNTALQSFPLLLNACSTVVFKEGGCLTYCLLPCLLVSSVHHPLSMVNAAGGEGFSSESLYLFHIGHCLQYPVNSSPYSRDFGRQWSSILVTCPSQCSCILRSLASILGTSAMSRT